MKNSTSPQYVSSDMRLALCSALTALAVLLPGAVAHAASATWNAAPTDGNWVTSGAENNWGTGVATSPGMTSGTTNADTATFNNASSTTAITINSSTLNVENITFDTAAGSFTLSSGGLLLTNGGTIQLASTVTSTGKTESINTPITLEGNYTFANNSTTTDLLNFGSAGGVTSGATSGTTTLSLAGGNTGSNVIDGIISNGGGTNIVSIAKSGSGTWLLGAANTYTGATAINQGTLTLDFTQAGAPATNIVNSSSALIMGGGAGSATLNVIGASGATNSQAFQSTTFNQGSSFFTINNNATSNPTLVSLGTIARNEGATVNFTQPVNGTVSGSNGYTTSSTNVNGILGGWATIGNDWASNNGTNIVAYTGYTSSNGASNPPSGWSAGQNISIDGALSGTLVAGTVASPGLTTINSLRFNNPATTVIGTGSATFAVGAYGNGTTVFTPTSGSTTGLYVGELVTAPGSLNSGDYITSLTGTTFTLASAATSNQPGGGTFTAATSQLLITSGGILVTSGVGTNISTISAGLLLGPANGDLVINQMNGTGTNSALVISAPISNNGSSPTGLTKAGAGYVTLTSGGNSFTGPVSVDAGTLEIDPTTIIGATYIAAGATLTQLPSAGAAAAVLTVGSLTGNGTLKYGTNSPTGNFTINETTSTTFNGVITGVLTGASVGNSMIVNKIGAGTLNLTAVGGLTNYRGFVVNGGTLEFSGNGTLADLGTFGTTNSRLAAAIGQGAAITLDDTVTNVGSRLSRVDEAFTINGGSFNLLGSSTAATVETVQTKGTVSEASHGLIMGAGSDIVNATAGTGQSTTLTFNDVYTRNAGASVLFAGTSLGSAPGNNVVTIKFGTAPTLTGTGSAGTANFGIMAGTVVDSITSGTINNFSIATYDATNGVRALAGSETIGTLTAGDNVLATSALTNSATTINSLTLGAGGSVDNTSGTLVVAAGTILSTGSANSIGIGGGSGLESGTTGAVELVIYNAPSSTLTIGAGITGSAGLTVGGGGTTILAANNATTLTGTVTINSGTLSFSADNALGAATNAVAINNGGTLESTGSFTDSRTITIGGTVANTITQGNIDVSGSSNVLTLSGTVNGVGSLVKTDVGTLVLTGSNTFTGQLNIQNGTLSIASVSASGSAQPLGENSTIILGSAGAAGTLQYTGTSATLAQNVTLNGNGTINNTGGHTLTLSGTLNKANTVLTLSSGTFNVTGQITGGNTSTFNSDFDVNNATVTVSNTNNNYTGPTVVYNGGTLLDGTNNALPAGTVLTTGSSTDGAVTNTYNLNGFNQSIAALDSAGGGTNIVTNTGISTLTLTGTNSDNTIVSGSFGGSIGDGSGKTSLVITGGTQTLSGSNGYSGGTIITGGNLVAANSVGTATGTNTVTVIPALGQVGTLSGNGIIGGQVITSATSGSVGVAHIAPGVNVSGVNNNFGTAGVLHLSNGLTIGNGTNLDYDLGPTSDLINVTGNLSLGSNVVLNYQAFGGSLVDNTPYDLINFSGTLLSGSAALASWTASGTLPVGATGYTFAITSGTEVTITFNGGGVVTPAVAYWQGGLSGTWATVTSGSTNFTSDAAGTTNTGAIPGAATNVKFTANSAGNLNTVLGQDFTINSLEFTGTGSTAATTSVTIGGTNTLTIMAGGTNGNTAGNGITVDAGSAAHTISSNVALGSSQTWTVSGSALTVSGNVSSGGNAYGLTKSGMGTLILSGSDSYSGTTAVNAGALEVDGSLSGSSAVTVGAATLSGTGNIGGSVALTGTSNLGSVGTLTVASLGVSGGGNTISSGTVNATGGTTINSGGNLAVNSTLAGSVGVSGVLSGTGKLTGAVTVSAGGVTSPGVGSAPGVLTSDLAYNASSTANFNVASGSSAAPQVNLSKLYYSQMVVTGGSGAVSLAIGNNVTLGANSATSIAQTGSQIQGDGSSNSGVTLQLSLSSADYATLLANKSTNYNARSGNTGLDNYFVFNLGTTLSTGRFTALDIDVTGGTNASGTIYYSGTNDRFATDGVGNTIGDVFVNGQEYALSYTGNFGTNSTIGGDDIVLTAIPEPGTWGMILGGFGMLVGFQRFRKRRVV